MTTHTNPNTPPHGRIREWADELPVVPSTIAPITPAGTSNTLTLRSSRVVSRSDAIRGTQVTLSIPLDEVSGASARKTVRPADGEEDDGAAEKKRGAYGPRKKVLRRDSLERREALLKGKEGSRQRRRWENDRLMNNPWAQPPLPSDWEVHPTYPRTVVPYFLAPLWEADANTRARRMSKKQAAKAHATQESRSTVLPRELREKLKRAKSAKGLLMDLEIEVRAFVEQWNERLERMDAMEAEEREAELENAIQEDSSDEEVVFVGRNGRMRDMPPSPQAKERKSRPDSSDDDMLELETPGMLAREKLVFGGLVDDQGASFARWIVHSIGDYYGLRTWSVTAGNPARREAYVGIDTLRAGEKPGERLVRELPRPLWGLV